VFSHRKLRLCWFRTLGILKLKINSPTDIEIYRFNGNPLKHLNGLRVVGTNPYSVQDTLEVESSHYLLPATSMYSIGFPYKQYIGLIKNSSPYFLKPARTGILIHGPREKENNSGHKERDCIRYAMSNHKK